MDILVFIVHRASVWIYNPLSSNDMSLSRQITSDDVPRWTNYP
jgi:hypothetical protein